jgi:hypothetical protein
MAVSKDDVGGPLGMAEQLDVGTATPGSLSVLMASTSCCVDDEVALDAGCWGHFGAAPWRFRLLHIRLSIQFLLLSRQSRRLLSSAVKGHRIGLHGVDSSLSLVSPRCGLGLVIFVAVVPWCWLCCIVFVRLFINLLDTFFLINI